MGDKIISEIRFVETEDGYRIEIKGDKERLKKKGFGPDWFSGGFGPGPEFNHGPYGRGRGWNRSSWKHGLFGGFGPWAWIWDCRTDTPDHEDSSKKPPKDV